MAEYAYRIKHNKGSFIHLLQNGKYLSVPSFPLTPETPSPTRSGDYSISVKHPRNLRDSVSPSAESTRSSLDVLYTLHLPSFTCISLFSLSPSHRHLRRRRRGR